MPSRTASCHCGQLRIERPQFDGLRRLDGPDGPRVVFQMWDWDAEGDAYTVSQFILQEVDPGGGVDRKWISDHYQTRYRALTRAELEVFIAEAGFGSVRWNTSDFYQPVLIARR